jgi:hypothetical protein
MNNYILFTINMKNLRNHTSFHIRMYFPKIEMYYVLSSDFALSSIFQEAKAESSFFNFGFEDFLNTIPKSKTRTQCRQAPLSKMLRRKWLNLSYSRD